MTTLVNRVGQKLSLTIGTSSNPSQSQIVDWLNEGLDTLMRLLPYDYFPNSQTASSNIASTAAKKQVSGPLPTNHIKLIGAKIRNTKTGLPRPCKIVPVEAYDSIYSGIDVFRTVTNDYPIATIRGGNIYIATSASAASKKFIGLDYLAQKTATASTTSCSENPIIDSLVVNYAVMQAKYSDDDTQDWAAKLQEWYKSMVDFSFGQVPVKREG